MTQKRKRPRNGEVIICTGHGALPGFEQREHCLAMYTHWKFALDNENDLCAWRRGAPASYIGAVSWIWEDRSKTLVLTKLHAVRLQSHALLEWAFNFKSPSGGYTVLPIGHCLAMCLFFQFLWCKKKTLPTFYGHQQKTNRRICCVRWNCMHNPKLRLLELYLQDSTSAIFISKPESIYPFIRLGNTKGTIIRFLIVKHPIYFFRSRDVEWYDCIRLLLVKPSHFWHLQCV